MVNSGLGNTMPASMFVNSFGIKSYFIWEVYFGKSDATNGPELKAPLEVRVAITVKDLPKLRQLFQEAFGLNIMAEWHNEGGKRGDFQNRKCHPRTAGRGPN